MTKNTKTFATASTALNALAAQLTAEAKTDPRLARTKKRADRLVAGLAMALKKYEIVHSRKVPAKIAQRTGATKKPVKKAKAKKVAKKAAKPTAEIIQLKTAAAASRRQDVKRSK